MFNSDVTFFLFKFHNYFDGILGYESLSELQAVLDTGKHKLIFPNTSIDLSIRQLNPETHTVEANSVTQIKVPVSHESGNVFYPLMFALTISLFRQDFMLQKIAILQHLQAILEEKWFSFLPNQ